MDHMLSLKEKLSFDKVDLTAPDKVIKEVGNELSEITQGMVKCNVKSKNMMVQFVLLRKPKKSVQLHC